MCHPSNRSNSGQTDMSPVRKKRAGGVDVSDGERRGKERERERGKKSRGEERRGEERRGEERRGEERRGEEVRVCLEID